MKTLTGAILLVAVALTLPLVTACWGCEGGPIPRAYAQDVAAVTLDAGTAVIVPLTVSASTLPTTDSLGVEVSITDCSAGSLVVHTRLRRADGTVLSLRDGGSLAVATTATQDLRCPSRSAIFSLPPSELTCTSGRCTASLQVELTSDTGAGPREVNLHLVTTMCGPTLRTDGAIDAWGE